MYPAKKPDNRWDIPQTLVIGYYNDRYTFGDLTFDLKSKCRPNYVQTDQKQPVEQPYTHFMRLISKNA